MLLAAIDAHKKRDNMTVDIPNAFIQTPLEQSDGNKQTIMKITGVLVDMLVSIDPIKYQDYVVIEKGHKTLYVQLLQMVYGMLQAALLWYVKFKRELEEQGFEFNPYNPCVANKMVNGKQQTI